MKRIEISESDIVTIRHKGIAEGSQFFDLREIALEGNHLMFRDRKGELVFKVWLKKEDFKDIRKAMDSVGLEAQKI